MMTITLSGSEKSFRKLKKDLDENFFLYTVDDDFESSASQMLYSFFCDLEENKKASTNCNEDDVFAILESICDAFDLDYTAES